MINIKPKEFSFYFPDVECLTKFLKENCLSNSVSNIIMGG